MTALQVLFIAQNTPIYVAEFWEKFSEYIGNLTAKGVHITGIVSLETLGKKNKIDLLKQVHSFYGSVGTIKLGMKFLLLSLVYWSFQCLLKF